MQIITMYHMQQNLKTNHRFKCELNAGQIFTVQGCPRFSSMFSEKLKIIKQPRSATENQ